MLAGDGFVQFAACGCVFEVGTFRTTLRRDDEALYGAEARNTFRCEENL